MRRRTMLLGTLAMGLPTLARAATMPTVVELFTSQGCSSCPPADAYLGELSKQPGVLALAWHVDYWNSLGWRDPFASRQSTERQRAYAAHLHDEVYTPALVVNGAAMVVGSDRHAVRQAMEQTPPPAITVTLQHTPDGLKAATTAWPEHTTALLIVYDPQTATSVGAGENAGHRLTEYRIVREAREISLKDRGISLPAIAPNQGAALLLQDAAWRIIGAADLPPA